MIGGIIGTFGVDDIIKISDILQEARRQNTLAINELKYCEDRQNDLLHEIEFGSANRQHLGKMAKELRDIRIRRRNAKNTIKVVRPIIDWSEKSDNIRNGLYKAIGDTKRIAKELDESVYTFKTEEDKIIEHVDLPQIG